MPNPRARIASPPSRPQSEESTASSRSIRVSFGGSERETAQAIGHALVAMRTAAGLTQLQVASAMATTRTVIARLEGGEALPSTRTLHRFAQATGAGLDLVIAPASTSATARIPERHSDRPLPSLSRSLPMSSSTRDLRNPVHLANVLASRRRLLGGATALAAGAAASTLGPGASVFAQGTATANTSPEASPATGTRTITTPLGTYDIPLNPQRVVTIDSRLDLEPAIALDLPVIATSYDHPLPWVPVDPDLPLLEAPVDIEAVATLNPDLIVCVNLDSEMWPAPTLNRIAPVITTDFAIHWRDNLAQLSDWLGMTDRLQDALDTYDGMVADVRARHADAIAGKQVVYLQYFPTDAEVYHNLDTYIMGTVLTDLGGTPFGGFKTADTWKLSVERMNELAGADGFLVVNVGDDAPDQLAEHPLWQALPAVQAGAVVVSPGNVNYGSIYTAQEIVRLYDELYTAIG